MKKIYDRLFVGSIRDCPGYKEVWAVVHACMTTCHQKAVVGNGDTVRS